MLCGDTILVYHKRPLKYTLFPSVAQQPNSAPDRLTGEVSRSHTNRHTQPVGLLWANDQLISDAATYTTHNTHKIRTSMLSAGFETAIAAIEQLQNARKII